MSTPPCGLRRVPEYPVAWQNILYRGTAAYERPTKVITTKYNKKTRATRRFELKAKRTREERPKTYLRRGT